jgi:hypothetical protein
MRLSTRTRNLDGHATVEEPNRGEPAESETMKEIG